MVSFSLPSQNPPTPPPPFISALRPPLSVKYIWLTINRGFNGAIKLSILTTNKLLSAVEFGAIEGVGVVMVEHQLPLKSWKYSIESQNTPKMTENVVEVLDISCRYAQTPRPWKSSCSFPKIVENPANHPAPSQLTLKQNSITDQLDSFSFARLHL